MTAVSVVIPAFNRTEPLKLTLRSVACSIRRLGQKAEILLVDDGSSPTLQEQLNNFDAGYPIVHLRQTNQGSIVARQTGLSAAQGEALLFLDSDDLVPPNKLREQVEGLAHHPWDIVYGDMAVAVDPAGGGETLFKLSEVLPPATDPASFFLWIQPAPHNPIYRRDYLLRHLTQPLLPVKRSFDPAGDVWLYYNLCPYPARIGKLDTPVAAAGIHQEDRYSRQWEKLGLAALGVMEAFAESCPKTEETLAARRTAGECAFGSWRRLPRDFDPEFIDRTLRLWRGAPHGSLDRLGGKTFQRLARVTGAENAGRLLRLLNASYREVRTLSNADYHRVFPQSG